MHTFAIGCNYWASNAGMYMWRRFDETVVRKDLETLAKNGVQVLRVFPLWCDFQPIEKCFCTVNHDIRINDKPLEYDAFGRAGMDRTMMARFKTLLDRAEENGMSVIVSLLTGWMSGRLFIPSAIAFEDPLTSPLSLRWQKRFVKTFVSHFANETVISAWETGNECNCMGSAPSADAFAAWLGSITDAIRCADPSRPVYSGMHGLSCRGIWRFDDVSEYTDLFTVHPYPLFTAHCGRESLNTMRASLHAAAESVFYAGMGNKPCMVEEIGTLGPMVVSDEYSADYLEISLLSSFAYGATGYLWWCAFDHDKLDFSPYDTLATERNLGLAYSDGTPKKILNRLKDVSKRTKFELPVADKDAVAVLTGGQDEWTVAFGAFTLGVQSGINLDFMYDTQPLKDGKRYLLPSVCGNGGLPGILQAQLESKIKDGADLLITYDGGYVSNFETLTGLHVKGREERCVDKTFKIDGKNLAISCNTELYLDAAEAEILLASDDGNILLSRRALGKGFVYFFNAPLERYFTELAHPCDTDLYTVYETFFGREKKIASVGSKYCGVTVHSFNDNKKTLVVINYGKEDSVSFELSPVYKVLAVHFGELSNGVLHFDGKWAVLDILKK